ncbi:penicillin-binding transpeptidase domain-containing protein [Streptomycetaceae bacterium NBC_01309]
MNKPLRKVSVFCMLLVAALMVRTNWIQVVKADDYSGHDKNRRAVYEEYSHPRGDFFVENKPITGSVETDSKYYEYQRTYVNGPMYAPITGFKSQFFGSNFLEGVENEILNGEDDRLFVRRVIDVVTGKDRRGGNVDLTINAKAQEAAFNGLNGKTGAAVAIDPTTGKILAMASTPSYDPNKLAVNDSKAQQAEWDSLQPDKNPAQPMENRAIRTIYAPGSTFKLVTAAAALSSGKYQPDTATNFESPLRYPNSVSSLSDQAGSAACQGSTLKVALEKSCNSVFAGIGQELGDQAIKDQAQAFGFNDFGKYDFTKGLDTKNNLTIPTRVSASLYPANDEGGATMRASIGQQDVAATPLQMASVVATIANNGKVQEPYLVSSLRSQSLDTIEQRSSKTLNEAVKPEVASQLQDMMVGVVENGCTAAKIPGVKVGGKTGTAQRGPNNDQRPYAWFVSFAEVDGKKVAVAVVVEDQEADIDRNDISGCKSAAPIAVSMMKAALGK